MCIIGTIWAATRNCCRGSNSVRDVPKNVEKTLRESVKGPPKYREGCTGDPKKAILPQSGEGDTTNCRIFTGRGTPRNLGNFGHTDRVLYHIEVRTLYARRIFREKVILPTIISGSQPWHGQGVGEGQVWQQAIMEVR